MHIEKNSTGSVNLTTWAKQKYVFFKVTTSAIRVQVKCQAHAIILLATKLGPVSQYSILIKPENRNQIRIKLQNEHETFDVPDNIVSPLEYKIFDISWNAGNLSVQAEGFSFRHDKVGPEIFYITFGTLEGTDPVHWRFQLTPNQIRSQLQPITLKGMPNHKWVPMAVNLPNAAPVELPEDALIGGYEQDRLYVIRAKHRGSVTPGKFAANSRFAFIPWGGTSNEKTEFEVLCSINCKWVKSRDNLLPVDALEAGYSEISNERLYIGRAYHRNHLIVGKVQPSHKCCYISYENQEISIREFEVLVECKEPNERYAANELTIPEICEYTPVIQGPPVWPIYGRGRGQGVQRNEVGRPILH